MFIRTKKIKNKEYAYLVKNIWKKRKKSSRQKIHSYIGRVYKLEKSKNNELSKEKLEKSNSKKMTLNLIKTELLNHSFSETKNNIFENNEFKVNLNRKEVTNTRTKKQICLEMNNNFLCNYTLKKLVNFSPKQGLTKLQVGRELANNFEAIGIKVPKEIFVIIAKKVLNDIEKS